MTLGQESQFLGFQQKQSCFLVVVGNFRDELDLLNKRTFRCELFGIPLGSF